MAHNVSRERQEQIEREKRLAELKPFLVPGWQLDRTKAQIVEVPTVLGHYQRGQQLLLRCRREDCRRRVEANLRSAIEAGLGDRPVTYLLEPLRCGQWDGCALVEVSATYPEGVPLVGFLAHRDALIAIACAHCGTRSLLPPREVIRKLEALKRGNGNTGLLALARAVRGPCRQCHRRQFVTGIVWGHASRLTSLHMS